MADEVKTSKTSKNSGAKKSPGKFFKEIKSELKKVIWPTRAQLVNNTMTVLLCCLLIGFMIWVFDAGLNKLIEVALKKGAI
jgi:preprotein translocase subunit SecE